jgi:DNA (cytosine-5)-methyltransferase 1
MGGSVRAVHLCCGAGGTTLGFERAGIATAYAFDVSPVVVETHRANFPGAPCEVRDVREVRAGELPRADVWTCGIPCAPFSEAGLKLGHRDGRDVSPELARLIAEACAGPGAPRYVFLENVRPYRESVGAELIRAALRPHYDLFEAVFRHADYGVPQLRRRWHLLAALKPHRAPVPEPTHAEHPNLLGLEPWVRFGDVRERDPQRPRYMSARALKGIIRRQRRKMRIAVERGCGAHSTLYVVEDHDLMPTVMATAYKGISRNQAVVVFDDYRFRCPTELENARAQGFPDDFVFCGSARQRSEQIGRAVPVQFAGAVARAIAREGDE